AAVAGAAVAKKAAAPGLACAVEADVVAKLSGLTDEIWKAAEDLDGAIAKISQGEDIVAQSEMIRDEILPRMEALRTPSDEAETLTAREFWPFPIYGDLLFGVK
ncbi:MAG: glutamine synthetase type III, partial [Lachnospiraceae bacterium]|nr:glutamine synthetase type III [Lachnospiraceae bacterium]